MNSWKHLRAVAFGLAAILVAAQVKADGAIGEHVNNMKAHLDDYSEEVSWMIGKIDEMVDTYAESGVEAAQPDNVVEYWEAVDFHSAIETNYIPLYASIWQGLFAVKGAIEEEQPVEQVRAAKSDLDAVLWQSLGAVKVAAEYQARGMLPPVANTEAANPVETVDIIKRELHRVVAKYAEKLSDDAIEIVQQTYLTRFEGIEGDLISLDAALVEGLEIDFNVKLPKAIQDEKSIDEVREVVELMQSKLDRCRSLLADAEANRSDVF